MSIGREILVTLQRRDWANCTPLVKAIGQEWRVARLFRHDVGRVCLLLSQLRPSIHVRVREGS